MNGSIATPAGYGPFGVLLARVAFVVVAITRLRMHPFLAVILAAFLAGFRQRLLGCLPARWSHETKETLRSSSLLVTIVSLGGVLMTLLLFRLFPFTLTPSSFVP